MTGKKEIAGGFLGLGITFGLRYTLGVTASERTAENGLVFPFSAFGFPSA